MLLLARFILIFNDMTLSYFFNSVVYFYVDVSFELLLFEDQCGAEITT